ncbi:ribonuclease R [Hoeflea sp. YIM 152468]|uniref:ribonuclease R n=1 Tax=Hoeflea sp. YIM 152468 TaxID=3031759 RepID=UPI0023D9B731|nr:ribonuclease R [Hoeflea sp. YIM 152468]MDF1607090.1 ribonuclease R [Hoeflea sp. YIM 152468]
MILGHPPRKPGTGKSRPGKAVEKAAEARPFRRGDMPDKDMILRFLSENPDRATKRDVAKAFGLKSDTRAELKDVLRQLEDEGLIERDRKTLRRPGTLPAVAVLEITLRNAEGDLIARPAEWLEDHGAAPTVTIRQSNSGRGRGKSRTPSTAASVGDRVLARIFASPHGTTNTYTARIMKILDRRGGLILGVFRSEPGGGGRLMPIERRGEEFAIDADSTGDAKDGDLVEVETTKPARMGLPRAKVHTVLGSVDGEKAISMIAIHDHGIPHVFPAEVIEAAENAKPAPLAGREDWRHVPLITIDPSDAKDHDDAVHAEADPSTDNPGGVIVTVAIADVSWYVRSGAGLDREALKRGNSAYFPDRVVPMLPERISNDLCSLREGEDRPALALRMVFSSEGRKVGHRFHRVMMKSAAKLSYQQAQAAIDGHPDDTSGPLLDPVLKPLWAAYGVLKRERARRQPLDLDMPERKILLTSEGKVDKVVVPERLDAHKLIEEFMIQANVAAAETLEKRRQPLIYRVHDQPSLAKQEVLREFLGTLGLSLARGAAMRANAFNGILSKAAGEPYQDMVNEMVLRSQSQAIYSPENLGHFGLNLMKYAHFTSPIRRYADLIVHRALVGTLGLGEGGITPAEEAALETIAAEISTTERRAMAAERDTVDRLVAHHLAGRLGEAFDGRISGVTKSGLFISLPQFGADGFIPVSTLGLDYYHYDEAHQALTGEKTGLGYRLGDSVEIKIVEVIPLAGSMRFEMLSEGQKMPTGTRSFHKSGRARKGGPKKPGTRPSRGRR